MLFLFFLCCTFVMLVVRAEQAEADYGQTQNNDYQRSFGMDNYVLSPQDFANAHSHPPPQRYLTAGFTGTPSPGKFEGDIAGRFVGHMEERRRMNPLFRNAIREEVVTATVWPGGRMFYRISDRYGPEYRKMLALAMEEFYKQTCITIVPRNNEPNYTFIREDVGCYSDIAMTGGRQTMSLTGEQCKFKGTIMHEFMHTAGFLHEHSRPDRDKYVKIHMSNMGPDGKDQFNTTPVTVATQFGTKYDYTSIMHYGQYFFTKCPNNYNRGPECITVETTNSAYQKVIGLQTDFSNTDILRVAKLYGCKNLFNRPGDDKCFDKWTECEGIKNGDPQNCMRPLGAKNCRLTCGKCNPKCRDENPHCEYWSWLVGFGFCEEPSTKTYAAKACAKTCGCRGDLSYYPVDGKYCSCHDRKRATVRPQWDGAPGNRSMSKGVLLDSAGTPQIQN